MKSDSKTTNKSLKRKMLKFIRDRQNDALKTNNLNKKSALSSSSSVPNFSTITASSSAPSSLPTSISTSAPTSLSSLESAIGPSSRLIREFNNEFEESLRYLAEMEKKQTEERNKHQTPQTKQRARSRTIRHSNLPLVAVPTMEMDAFPQVSDQDLPHYSHTQKMSVSSLFPGVSTPVPPSRSFSAPSLAPTQITESLFPSPTTPLTTNTPTTTLSGGTTAMNTNVPSFGCLKGGRLPTYRNWRKAQTFRQPANVHPPAPTNLRSKLTLPNFHRSNVFDDPLKRMALRAKQEEAKLAARKKAIDLQACKKAVQRQKRTIRRTFHLGKSKIKNHVGVLISNKTIRSTIATQRAQLHQVPIQDVKKALIKKGLIRVGTTCPNDVLRQMYESMVLMGGELTNHNAENMLFNFLTEEENEK